MGEEAILMGVYGRVAAIGGRRLLLACSIILADTKGRQDLGERE